jgi:hypothetical protein
MKTARTVAINLNFFITIQSYHKNKQESKDY